MWLKSAGSGHLKHGHELRLGSPEAYPRESHESDLSGNVVRRTKRNGGVGAEGKEGEAGGDFGSFPGRALETLSVTSLSGASQRQQNRGICALDSSISGQGLA